MGIVKQPLHIDFVVENRPLTTEEEKKIKEYIILQKSKKQVKKKNIRKSLQTNQNM